MERSIDLETHLIRRREVFNHYITNRGREISLLPLLKKYSAEDGIPKPGYSFEYIEGLLIQYLESDEISREQTVSYNNTKKISKNIIMKRGREIIMAMIESKCDWSVVVKLGEKYAKEDGKIRPYSDSILYKYRNYYFDHTDEEDIKIQYAIVFELAKRSTTSGYDIEFVNSITKMESVEKAVALVKNVGISKTSLKSLRNAYGVLYPANEKELGVIDEIIENAYAPETPVKFVESDGPSKSALARIERLKPLLEDYLCSDYESIEVLFPQHKFTKYSFKEVLKDTTESRDLILRNLLDKYFAKEDSILMSKKMVTDSIVDGIKNGVNYGKGFRTFNTFDLFQLTRMTVPKIVPYLYKLYNKSLAISIKEKLEKMVTSRTYETADELMASVNYSLNGRTLTDEEKLLIVTFMEQGGWPYMTNLFNDTARRYIEGDLVLELVGDDESKEIEKDNSLNVNKL